MRVLLRWPLIAAVALLCAGSFVGAAHAVGTTHYVAPPPSVAGLDTSCTFPGFNTIQAAVAASNPGDTIVVCSGVYDEQVTVGKNLTLAGSGNAIIQAPAALVPDANGKNEVVEVNNGASVTMSGFTVAGPSAGGQELDTGIAVHNGATLDLSNTTVRGIHDNPTFTGAQHGEGIRVGTPRYDTTPQVGHATINNVAVLDYQKNGIVIAGTGSTGKITNTTVTGQGQTPVIGENGVEVVDGAAATLSTTTMRDNFYTGTQNVKACGLLIIGASGVNDDKTDVYLNDQQNKCTVSGRGGTYEG
jgi:hypothetical protein